MTKTVKIGLGASLFIWLIALILRQDSYWIISSKIYFGAFMYALLAILCIRAFAKKRDPRMFIAILILAGGAYGLFQGIQYFHLTPEMPREINIFAVALIAILLFWLGIYLLQLKPDHGYKYIAEIALTSSAFLTLLFVGFYCLPKPVKDLGVQAIWGLLIFFFAAIAFASASRFVKSHGNGLPKWIVSISLRLMSIGALYVCLVWLNNVIYSGCASFPIGQPCMDNNYQANIPDDSLVTSKITANDLFPETVVIQETVVKHGAGICQTLNMTRQEALDFAIENGLKHWVKNDVLYVLVYPGDRFILLEEEDYETGLLVYKWIPK